MRLKTDYVLNRMERRMTKFVIASVLLYVGALCTVVYVIAHFVGKYW